MKVVANKYGVYLVFKELPNIIVLELFHHAKK